MKAPFLTLTCLVAGILPGFAAESLPPLPIAETVSVQQMQVSTSALPQGDLECEVTKVTAK